MRWIPVALLVALLAACDPAPALPTPRETTDTAAPSVAAAPPVVVRFAPDSYSPELQASPYAALAAQFNQQNPDVRVELVSPDVLLKGTEGQPYDVVDRARRVLSGADVSGALYDLEQVVKLGFVKDLTPFIAADTRFRRDDFSANALEASSVAGRIYRVPWMLQVGLLAYNKALWAERGLAPPDPGWSWDDLLRAASTIARKRGDTVETYGLKDDIALAPFLHLLAARGVNLLATPLASVRLDDPEAIAAMGQLKELVDSGALYLPPRNADDTFPGASAYAGLFRAGKIGVWEYALTTGEHAALSALPYPLGVALVPPSPLGADRFGSMGYVMSSGTQHPNEAWRWISFVSRQVVNDPNYAGAEYLPARPSVADAAGYWKRLAPDVAAVVRAALAEPLVPERANAIDLQTRNALLQPLFVALGDVTSGRKDAPTALRDAQAQLAQRQAQVSAGPQPTAGALAVVTPTTASANPNATPITFGLATFDHEGIARVAERFNAAQGDIAVTVRAINNGGSADLAKAAVSADCFAFYRPPINYEETAALLDLGPLLAADRGFPRDDYPAALLGRFAQAGRQLALPHAVNPRVLAYNQTLFDAAKQPYPRADWTLDELRAAAVALTGGPEDKRTYGWAPTYDSLTSQLSMIAEHFGASLVRGSGDTIAPNFTDQQVARALQFYAGLMRDAAPPPSSDGYASDAYADINNALTFDGRVAMWVSYGMPRTAPESARRTFITAVAPLPAGPQGASTDYFASGLYISARTAHADACWAWMQYLEAQPDGMAGSFPARRSLAASPQWAALSPLGAAAIYPAFAAGLDSAPPGASNGSLWTPPLSGIWLTRAIDGALQGGDLEAVLADAQFKTEQYAACVRGGEAAATCEQQVDPSGGASP